MLNSKPILDKFDFSSVTEVLTGAAPLGAETYRALLEQYPSWFIKQGYGLTETSSAVSLTSARDVLPGSSGNLLPGLEARIISIVDGSDITEYDQPGELLVRSRSVTSLGYLNNSKATDETFGTEVNGWLRTGDEAVFRPSPDGEGYEHLFIIDRIKELIKVNVSSPANTLNIGVLRCRSTFRATRLHLRSSRLAYWSIRWLLMPL